LEFVRLNGPGDLFVFQRQLKLVKGFGPCAELVAAQTCQLMLQLLNPAIALFVLCLEYRQFLVLRGDYRLQFGDVTGAIGGCFEDVDLYQITPSQGLMKPQAHAVVMENYRLSGSE
jgi:hypothetical protein